VGGVRVLRDALDRRNELVPVIVAILVVLAELVAAAYSNLIL
jgi:hypothetical protein